VASAFETNEFRDVFQLLAEYILLALGYHGHVA
jgi:hypothetical protein